MLKFLSPLGGQSRLTTYKLSSYKNAFFSIFYHNFNPKITMNPKDELKAVLIHTIVLQLQILNPEKYKLGIGRDEKILLEILNPDELEGIIQIYQEQINAMILARKTKLLGERLQPDHYCHN